MKKQRDRDFFFFVLAWSRLEFEKDRAIKSNRRPMGWTGDRDHDRGHWTDGSQSGIPLLSWPLFCTGSIERASVHGRDSSPSELASTTGEGSRERDRRERLAATEKERDDDKEASPSSSFFGYCWNRNNDRGRRSDC